MNDGPGEPNPNPFWRHFFAGLESGLENLDAIARQSLLACCGQACAESCPLARMQSLWQQTGVFHDFFMALGSECPEIRTEVVSRHHVYDVIYTQCMCDLVVHGYITSGWLCDCSRSSLLFILRKLSRRQSLQVEIIQSILRGHTQCRLRVHV